MIISLDGPAGSGKSTTAREVARRLGFPHLDSGAFYRALTAAALQAGIDTEEWSRLSRDQLDALDVTALRTPEGFRMRIRGGDASGALRTAEVTSHVSEMARVPAVRAWLLERLRAAAQGGDLVADGRDMGTVVFPNADLKFYVVAEPHERARRRLAERGIEDPAPEEIEIESARLLDRDRIDSQRAVAPLKRAPDAILLDTTRLSFEEQVAYVVDLAKRAS